jgi:Flp pilus assembly pilin Flp
MEKEFIRDEGGQGAAEYILLFGGVIVIAIAILSIYQTYQIMRRGGF